MIGFLQRLGIFFFIGSLIVLPLFAQEGDFEDLQKEKKPVVLVSLAPYKYFIQRIAGDSLQVEVLVPEGSSPHHYEPKPSQLMRISASSLWFRVGEPSEEKTLSVLRQFQPGLQTVVLSEGLELIYEQEEESLCCHNNSFDPHIWLSPRLAKVQATKIATVLCDEFPDWAADYINNLQELLHDLDGLEKEVSDNLRHASGSMVMMSHPAYAYLCRDYGIGQFSVELEGKEPSPRQLAQLIEKARENHVTTIFIQKQYSQKGARAVAGELGAEIITLDPYNEDYPEIIRQAALHFAVEAARS